MAAQMKIPFPKSHVKCIPPRSTWHKNNLYAQDQQIIKSLKLKAFRNKAENLDMPNINTVSTLDLRAMLGSILIPSSSTKSSEYLSSWSETNIV